MRSIPEEYGETLGLQGVLMTLWLFFLIGDIWKQKVAQKERVICCFPGNLAGYGQK